MKKVILIIISIVFAFGLFTACSSIKKSNSITNEEQNKETLDKQDVREIAFNQLTTSDKKRISGTWKDGELSKITLEEGMGNVNDKEYIGKEVYIIDFPTEDISRPNNIIVYLGVDNINLIGYGYVD